MFGKFDVSLPVIKDIMFDIRDYGAVGDGVTSNTQMFKDAICAAAECGGRVLVPDGIWLTGPIELLSGVELHLSDNALKYLIHLFLTKIFYYLEILYHNF